MLFIFQVPQVGLDFPRSFQATLIFIDLCYYCMYFFGAPTALSLLISFLIVFYFYCSVSNIILFSSGANSHLFDRFVIHRAPPVHPTRP